MLKSLISIVVLAFGLPFPAAAEDFVGRASVIDGDTVEIQGKPIRMHAIDAPEAIQLCRSESAGTYRCGQQAALALADFIGTQLVSCMKTDIDRHQRVVAVCSVNGTDLNGWMVEQGHALAYRQYGQDYLSHEERAREAGRGIWTGKFVPPWDWRRGVRLAEAQPADSARRERVGNKSECEIKGNISDSGRIYHLPGSRDYASTRIDPSRGERWFCSIEEAVRAGWRASRG